MKYEIIINPNAEERVVIYAKENNPLTERIKELIEESAPTLTGYCGSEIKTLLADEIYCITVIDNKVFALLKAEKFLIKKRLYILEDILGEQFIKINQSCLANIKKIEGFDASVSGTLKVRFKNGYTDYVSRRQLKFVKERLGL